MRRAIADRLNYRADSIIGRIVIPLENIVIGLPRFPRLGQLKINLHKMIKKVVKPVSPDVVGR